MWIPISLRLADQLRLSPFPPLSEPSAGRRLYRTRRLKMQSQAVLSEARKTLRESCGPRQLQQETPPVSGKCPNCEREVASAKLDAMELAGDHVRMKAFSVSCPYCYTVMAILRDPQPMDV